MAQNNVKTFACDDTVLDPAIKKHIATLYAAVDNKELEFWGSHFTEDAELKKGTSNVKGRQSKSLFNFMFLLPRHSPLVLIGFCRSCRPRHQVLVCRPESRPHCLCGVPLWAQR
jgi:hypothetical protein